MNGNRIDEKATQTKGKTRKKVFNSDENGNCVK